MKKVLGYIALAICIAISSIANAGFQFAILGDRTGSADQEVFEKVVHEIKQLHPDFVINVGDLIEGYITDVTTINARWDTVLNTLSILDCPIYFVPGNQDIWDDQSEELYQKRTRKKPCYSFDYHNSHFIILNNSLLETWDNIDENQFKWLKSDLSRCEKKSRYKKQNVFCFFHKPFWIEALSSNQEDILHNKFKERGVTHVMSGHYHWYSRTTWDGIEYKLIGSSGGSMYGSEAMGRFYGYAWVTVDRNDVDITYIKLGNIIPEDALSLESIKELEEIIQKDITLDPLTIEEPLADEIFTVTLGVKNVSPQAFTETVTWNTDGCAWEVMPQETTCTFEKDEITTLSFQFKNTIPDNLFPLPGFEFTYPHEGWGEHKIQNTVIGYRKTKVAKLDSSPIIDGTLNDECWTEGTKLRKLYGYTGKTKVEPTDIFMGYDQDNLFIAVRCTESEVDKIKTESTGRDAAGILGDDCVLVYFDPDTEDNKMHQIIVNATGTIMDQWVEKTEAGFQRHRDWDGEWEVATRKEENAWILELKVPFSMLETAVASGTEWGFNIGRIQPRVSGTSSWQQALTIDPEYFGRIVLQ